jgi:hypothetical protein
MTLEHESVVPAPAPAPILGAERELVAQAEYILTAALKSNEVKLDSPMQIVTKTMEIAERFKYLDGKLKKKLLLEVLTRVAAGADGVAGTADDLIPAKTMATLKMMLESDLVDQTVDLVSDIAHGRFKIGDLATLGQTAMAAVSANAAAGGPAARLPCAPCLPFFSALAATAKAPTVSVATMPAPK